MYQQNMLWKHKWWEILLCAIKVVWWVEENQLEEEFSGLEAATMKETIPDPENIMHKATNAGVKSPHFISWKFDKCIWIWRLRAKMWGTSHLSIQISLCNLSFHLSIFRSQTISVSAFSYYVSKPCSLTEPTSGQKYDNRGQALWAFR